MGLFDIFNKNDGAVETGLTTGAVGALIGDKLDERQWRQDMLRLSAQQLAQSRFDYEMRQVDKMMEAAIEWQSIILKYGEWGWLWQYPTVCEGLHRAYNKRHFTDPVFRDRVLDQYHRWAKLRRRANTVGLMPFIFMPRTLSGDVAGTEKVLKWAMDRLEAQIDLLERGKALDHKYGGG